MSRDSPPRPARRWLRTHGWHRPDPAPREVRQTARAYDQLARTYSERWRERSNLGVVAARGRFARRLPRGGLVIDLGCGPGRDGRAFRSMGLRVLGLDVSSGMARQARRGGIRYVLLADMRMLPLRSGVVDGVWMTASFLHVPKQDALATLQGCARVMRPGGVLYLATRGGGGEEWLSLDGGPARFFAFYGVSELAELIAVSGFSVIKGWSTSAGRAQPRWIHQLLVKPPLS
jgi:SAM-dependent methyltransferase